MKAPETEVEKQMDSIKLEKLITENMKSIFGFALTRLGNVTDAEYLASDILYEIIKSAKNLKEEERFYGFMWKIAENVYVDFLRKRSKITNRTTELDENIADETESALEKIIKKEDLNLLRRELSLLSKQYRDATVLYYIENLSCFEVAKKLQISTEMVKYYLFRARKIIREGMNMERLYGEKSYRPNIFEIDFWGTKAGDDREYCDFLKRKIKGNILLAAYYSSVTIQEISIELGVALPYLEDEIKLLIDRQYAKDERPDMWILDRVELGIKSAIHLVATGKNEDAITKLEPVVKLLEETMKITDEVLLPTSCRFLDGMEWIAKEDWIPRDNNPDSPKERMIYIATWMNGTCSCYCVFPSNYFDILNGKEFEPLRNYPKFGKICERVKALIIIKPNEK